MLGPGEVVGDDEFEDDGTVEDVIHVVVRSLKGSTEAVAEVEYSQSSPKVPDVAFRLRGLHRDVGDNAVGANSMVLGN